MPDLRQFLAETGRQSLLNQIQSEPGGYERAQAEYNATGALPSWGVTAADEMIRSVEQAVMAAIAPTRKEEERYGEYMEKNPFVFDEALARASAEERYDPYYDAELSDFMTGIERQRERSEQDELRLRTELTAATESYVGRHKRQLEQALRASREGFAGAGLYFSGARLRREGEQEVEAGATLSDYMRGQGIRREESQLREKRTLEDLGLRESTYRRKWGAERRTTLETDVEQQRREEALRRQYEATQYAGPEMSRTFLQSNPLLLGS